MAKVRDNRFDPAEQINKEGRGRRGEGIAEVRYGGRSEGEEKSYL